MIAPPPTRGQELREPQVHAERVAHVERFASGRVRRRYALTANNRFIGAYREWHDTDAARLRASGQFSNSGSGLRVGVWMAWRVDGQPLSRERYDSVGERAGVCVAWHYLPGSGELIAWYREHHVRRPIAVKIMSSWTQSQGVVYHNAHLSYEQSDGAYQYYNEHPDEPMSGPMGWVRALDAAETRWEAQMPLPKDADYPTPDPFAAFTWTDCTQDGKEVLVDDARDKA